MSSCQRELTNDTDGDSDATTLKRGDAFGAAETHLAALLSRLGHTTNAELHLAEPSELGALKVAAPAVAPASTSSRAFVATTDADDRFFGTNAGASTRNVIRRLARASSSRVVARRRRASSL